MILRKDDWYREEYSEAIVHWNTKNESFLKLAETQRLIGVEHWYCCLALINPDLEFVDPRSPDLTLEQKTMIAIEMILNPWYYFRELCLVPQDGSDPVSFGIHRGSFALIWCFFNNIDIALLLIRQQGKTVVIVALMLYLMRVLKNSRTILLTRDAGLRTETIDKIKRMRDHLPAYLWTHSRNDADNGEIFTYTARNNKLITAIAQGSKTAAESSARGLTAARFFVDEPAYLRFIRFMLSPVFASGTKARVIAEQNGIPYGNVLTTTPGKRDEEDGKFIYDMFHDGYYWDDRLIDIPTREQLIDVIRKNCRGDRVLIHAPFTHAQLGMTDLELYDAMSNASGTPEEKLRDFGLQWTSGSQGSPLSAEEADMIRKSVVQPVPYHEIYPNSYCLKWYYSQDDIKRNMQVPHVIGLDTSDAVGRDNISLVFVNSETLGVAATGIINESNLVVFANWISDILTRYPNTVLVIERKSSAPVIIDSLLLTLPARGIEPSRRIFNRIIQDRPRDDVDYKEFLKSDRPRNERFYEIYRKYFGFMTTGTSRKLLYGEVLQTAVRMAGHLIKDKQLADELLGLIVKDGRIDHKSSGNDDSVVAWLLAAWFMLFGKNQEYYGVSSRKLMQRQRVTSEGEIFDSAEYEERVVEQGRLAEEIDELCARMEANRNPFTRTNMERELRIKLVQLNLDTSQATTVGELQELIRNEKVNSRYL